MPKGLPKKRAGIQSVEIGMRVLKALADLGGASPLAAVVRGCNLSPSQTHRYLASLCEAGMVLQDAHGNYNLGPGALRLGLSALARIEVFASADAQLARFRTETGATVLMAALGPEGPTVVRWHVGNPPIVASQSVGSVLSLVTSATGQIFLAFRPDADTAALVKAECARNPQLTPPDIEAVRRKVRMAGAAHSDGTLIPGLDARSFPIFDAQGHAVLAATLVSRQDHPAKAIGEVASRLQALCKTIAAGPGSGRPGL